MNNINDDAPGGRPSWSGLLQISLVGIPLKAYPAVRGREAAPFHQYHADCGQRIRYAKQCPRHGAVDAAAVVKGCDYGPGGPLFLEPEELDPLRPTQDRALRLERFVEPDAVDPLLFSGRGLHLAPDGPAARLGYDVLRQALRQRRRWGLGRMVLGGQRQVVVVRPAATALVLHVLHYPELVRATPGFGPAAEPEAGPELQLACQLIDAAGGPVDWGGYRDESSAELRALIEAKLQGRPADEVAPPAILPLLEALRRSVAAHEPTESAPPTPTAKKRSPRKRTPTRRTA